MKSIPTGLQRRKELKTTACRSSRRIRDGQSRPESSSALLPCQDGFSGHDRSNAEAQVWIGSVSDLACEPINAVWLDEARTPPTSFHLMPSNGRSCTGLLLSFGVCCVWPEPALFPTYLVVAMRWTWIAWMK
ncbi:hypothetical protein BO94DRAFT_108685 [Aspergillus sclerotioniger CBS 115572]|uniref:Uncharacterized protein n=1 Tax=Aspergillus sclerotioniger CBS 115572 TaxID=1450535 RepID=A0A317WE25_9EURO|nr:hypothetical protein BO94DRAFT_108685 [Aspergillus sclerotioniger CBS 115572]PWY84633.1 hypothetical protein BO94DRAFT_108685 [Aspergillus sclerotioniger CBS 115572]